MRTMAKRTPKPRALPAAWRKAEYAALCLIAQDDCDNRVSENIFDVEDERTEVDSIIHRLAHESH